MFSTDDIAFVLFATLQQDVWPNNVQGWATLVVPTGVLFGVFVWFVNHFVVTPLKQDVTALRLESRKSARGLRRTVQTFVGKVDILSSNVRDCIGSEQTNDRKIAGLDARVAQTEKQYREIESELRDIRSLIEYKVLEKLNELTEIRKETK